MGHEKYVPFSFFTFLSETFFFASVHIWEVALEVCPETRMGLHAKCRVLCWVSTKTETDQ